MRPTTSANVERYLFEQGGWVDAQTLMDFWHLDERGLRRRLTGVHVAGEKGYIHVANATKEELEEHALREWKHGVKTLKNVKTLRFNHRTRRIPPPYEGDADWPAPVQAAPEPMPSVQPELLT